MVNSSIDNMLGENGDSYVQQIVGSNIGKTMINIVKSGISVWNIFSDIGNISKDAEALSRNVVNVTDIISNAINTIMSWTQEK